MVFLKDITHADQVKMGELAALGHRVRAAQLKADAINQLLDDARDCEVDLELLDEEKSGFEYGSAFKILDSVQTNEALETFIEAKEEEKREIEARLEKYNEALRPLRAELKSKFGDQVDVGPE